MRRFLLSAVLAASVAAPMPAFAFANDDNSDNERVCRRGNEPTLGSNIRSRSRVCKTRAEWRELEEHTQREIQQIRDGQAPNEPTAGAGAAGGPA